MNFFFHTVVVDVDVDDNKNNNDETCNTTYIIISQSYDLNLFMTGNLMMMNIL